MAENRLSGLNPLAYRGVEASAPPQFVYFRRDPTGHDYYNWRIGTLWLNQATDTVWMLAHLSSTPPPPSPGGPLAIWIRWTMGGPFAASFPTDDGIALPTALGVLNVLGQPGVVVTHANPPVAPNTIQINIEGGNVGDVLTGQGAGVPAIWAPLPAQGVQQINVDGGLHINPVAGEIDLLGAHWVTVQRVNPNRAEVALDNIAKLGDLVSLGHTNPALEVVTGDLWVDRGIINLPNTNAAGNEGIIQFNFVDWIQNYGNDNTFIGANAGNHTLNVATATDNNALGSRALVSLTTGFNNFSMGTDSGAALTSGSDNIFIGNGAGSVYTTETGNICLGIANPGIAGETGIIRIGNQTDPGWTSNSNNTFIGDNSGNCTFVYDFANHCGIANTGLGIMTLHALAPAAAPNSGSANTAIGADALLSLTSGSYNTACGTNAMGAAVGSGVKTGAHNCGFGASAMYTGEGSYNVAIGAYSAGNYGVAAESNNVIINSLGDINDNNTLRIGQATGAGIKELNRAFIQGIAGINVAGTAVVVSAAGQLGVVVSSIRYKTNVQDMGSASNKILELRPVTFEYKTDLAKKRNVGLIAEEVEKIMPEMVIYNKDGECETVRYDDIHIMLLNEVQKLHRRVMALEQIVNARS